MRNYNCIFRFSKLIIIINAWNECVGYVKNDANIIIIYDYVSIVNLYRDIDSCLARTEGTTSRQLSPPPTWIDK